MDRLNDIINIVSAIHVDMTWFLILSALMMFIGIYGFLTRRNTLAILISIELMLNAADINFGLYLHPVLYRHLRSRDSYRHSRDD